PGRRSYPVRSCLRLLSWKTASYLDIFSSSLGFNLLKWIQYDLGICILPIQIDEIVVVPQLEETRKWRVAKLPFFKHVLAIIGRTRCYHKVREQCILGGSGIVQHPIPDNVGTPPTFEVPIPVIFKGKFHTPFPDNVIECHAFERLNARTRTNLVQVC